MRYLLALYIIPFSKDELHFLKQNSVAVGGINRLCYSNDVNAVFISEVISD
ncbi:MAG: hypothetical protein IT233_09030 [Bacteroidia bacterium]|nr:hypothetical protein [Bacteroidia bacterium]